jgi:hypothetical protein
MTDRSISTQFLTSLRTYRRRDQRRTTPPRISLTERDIAIIDVVYRCRALTQVQIEHLVLHGKHNSYTQSRLADLYDCGYVYRHFLPTPYGIAPSPIVYVLDEAGATLLRQWYGEPIKWTKWQKHIKRDFLTHTLEINDVRIAIVEACKNTGYTVTKWVGEHVVKAKYDRVDIGNDTGKDPYAPILPDSYFVLEDTTSQKPPLHFFLELDRGTMTQKRFQTKIRAYTAYLKSGAYTRRYGTRSLRVLTVAEGEKRLKYLKATTEKVEGKNRFWFAALSKLMRNSALTTPIWQVAGREGLFCLIDSAKENGAARS